MRFDKHGHSVLAGELTENANTRCVKDGDDEENRVGAAGGGLYDVVLVQSEVLPQNRQAAGLPRGSKIRQAALKKMLIGKNRERRRAAVFIFTGNSSRIEVRAQQTLAGGGLLHLGDDGG